MSRPLERPARPAGWVHHPGEPVQQPLDYVVDLSDEAPGLQLHFVYTDDGLYAPAVIRAPGGDGPFPAVLCIHPGSGGLGVSYLLDFVRERGLVVDRLVEEGYLVCFTAGRMEHEDAYGSDQPMLLDHHDVGALFGYVQRLPTVDPRRVGIFGVSHGGEIQLKVVAELAGGPAALVPAEPAVVEFLGLRYDGPRVERNLQFRGDVPDDAIDLVRARERIARIPDTLPILVLGRDDDHLQGLFRKLHALLIDAGKQAEWDTWDHPVHAYQWGPRRGPNGYEPDPIQCATLERIVAFLNAHVRDRKA